MSTWRSAMTRIMAMAVKETAHIRRDPQTMIMALLMPVLLLLLFGYGVTFDLEHLPIAVVDQDHTHLSRDIIRAFGHSNDLTVVAELNSTSQAETMARNGKTIATLIIPRDFSRKLTRGETAKLQLVVDGSDSSTATQLINKADAIASAALETPVITGTSRAPRFAANSFTFYNPAKRSALLLVPGLVAYILAMLCVLLTALTIAREWERGSMEQLFTTPIRRGELILGKLLPYVALGSLGVLLVLAVGAWVFEVPIRGSLTALGVASLLFLLGMLAQGLFISVITKNQMVATQVGTMTSMLPIQLLSGFVFPIDNIPAPLRIISELMPATHFIASLRGILLRGNGFQEQLGHLTALGVFASFMVLITAMRFRRRLD